MVFDPQIVFDDGFYDLMEVRIPEGSLLKPRHPAALSCRTQTRWGAPSSTSSAACWQQGDPRLPSAPAGFSDSPHRMCSGYDRRANGSSCSRLVSAAFRARPVATAPTATPVARFHQRAERNTLEAYFPLRIETYETIAGLRRRPASTAAATRCGWPTASSERRRDFHPRRPLADLPSGVNGGTPSGDGRKRLLRARRQLNRCCRPKCDRVFVSRDDLLLFETWGGGGWGDRYADRAGAGGARRAARGSASRRRRGALRRGAGRGGRSHDDAATVACRAARSGFAPAVFDRGGEIEDLKARCLEETGLPPPHTPVAGRGAQAHGRFRRGRTSTQHSSATESSAMTLQSRGRTHTSGAAEVVQIASIAGPVAAVVGCRTLHHRF
jgi:N-methylhydantoinase B